MTSAYRTRSGREYQSDQAQWRGARRGGGILRRYRRPSCTTNASTMQRHQPRPTGIHAARLGAAKPITIVITAAAAAPRQLSPKPPRGARPGMLMPSWPIPGRRVARRLAPCRRAAAPRYSVATVGSTAGRDRSASRLEFAAGGARPARARTPQPQGFRVPAEPAPGGRPERERHLRRRAHQHPWVRSRCARSSTRRVSMPPWCSWSPRAAHGGLDRLGRRRRDPARRGPPPRSTRASRLAMVGRAPTRCRAAFRPRAVLDRASSVLGEGQRQAARPDLRRVRDLGDAAPRAVAASDC